MKMTVLRLRTIASFLLLTLLFEMAFPVASWALTGGPSQPEVQSFEPVGTSEMVDLFSGDFNYNIPLLDVEGYPINISYHSGITMDQEASWVGLGWNINPGVINRNMRGIPDDFNGEEIKKEMNMKSNETYGVSFGASAEIFGLDHTWLKQLPDNVSNSASLSMSASLGIFYNTYKGVGLEYSISPSLSIGGKNKPHLNLGLGLSGNSQTGLGVSPNAGLSYHVSEKDNDMNGTGAGMSVSAPYNNRTGLKALTFNMNASLAKSVPKKGTYSGTASATSSYVQGSQTYIPQLNMPFGNNNINFRFSLGTDAFAVHPGVFMNGYYTAQYLKSNREQKKAYGYMYSQNARGKDDVTLDFNREKDGALTDAMPNLPMTNYTYDLYSVSGQGVGGLYRLHRSDAGILHDDKMTNSSGGTSAGGEVGFGNLYHFGLDINSTFSNSYSGTWQKDHPSQMDFVAQKTNKYPLYEPAYFKCAGEMSVSDKEFYDKLKFDQPVRLGIDENTLGSNGYLIAGDQTENNSASSGNAIKVEDRYYSRARRDRRNQAITTLTAAEADKYGLEKNIINTTEGAHINGFGFTPNAYITRTESPRKSHSISEITALNPDGTRYVYGIPAYNIQQDEVTFNVNPVTVDKPTGQVVYELNDNTFNNNKGNDNFYSKTSLPPFAHSYLLTAVLSADYVDVTDNGISDDDLGNYTKINYTRINDAYQWRVPFCTTAATHNEGLRSITSDDKANYIYGKKEIWYVHSIETKNYIAEFTFGDRLDGFGVANQNGGLSTSQKTYRLEKITLYSKQDRIIHQNNAVPIKVVHFEYDYTLCRLAENNRVRDSLHFIPLTHDSIRHRTDYNLTGKLTLRSIYFTYGNSNKGKLSRYKFHYNSLNPDYNLKGYDRWGNFKPSSEDEEELSNSEYPYTIQDNRSTKSDPYSSAWTMTRVDLPSGGSININYEADDYAYVQDRPAMQMFFIKGFGQTDDYGLKRDILFEHSWNKNDIYKYIFFQLNESISGSEVSTKLYNKYIKYLLNGNQVDHIYFNCLVDLNNEDNYEFVRGYADLDYSGSGLPYGVATNTGGQNIGWIRVKPVKLGDEGDNTGPAHPIAKAAWQFTRMNASQLIYPDNETGSSKSQVLNSLVAMAKDIRVFAQGFNRYMRTKNNCSKVDLTKSWIRLRSPEGKKIGGGSRVKKITVSDNWQRLGAANTDPQSFEYGQEYSYTIADQENPGRTISSGVAAYEPMIGNEENPWRLPTSYINENKWAVDDVLYTEGPNGESFFPSPSVGYSRVRVANLKRTGVSRTATGFTIHEFYTAKDYPTFVHETSLARKEKRGNPVLKLLNFYNSHDLTASQGYTIELNDMHGKPKGQKVFTEGMSEDQSPKSSVTYVYQDDPSFSSGTGPKKLKNTVTVIAPDHTVRQAEVGVEMDFAMDLRESGNNTYSSGIQANVEVNAVPFPPLIAVIPIIIPTYSMEETRFRSGVITKVIHRAGILTKTIATEDGAEVSTENLAYDSETGEVLLTRTQNEFRDPVYNFTYPAHWAYDGMGQAYQNVGAEFSGVNNYGDSIILPNNLKPADYFVAGDEVITNRNDALVDPYWPDGPKLYEHLWVHKENGKLFFIDYFGNRVRYKYGGSYTVKIIRSGHRNMQAIPVGAVTSLSNPLQMSSSSGTLAFASATKIINASSVEFSDRWDNLCQYDTTQICDSISDASKDFRCLFSQLATYNMLQDATVARIDTMDCYENSLVLKTLFNLVTAGAGDVRVRVSHSLFTDPIHRQVLVIIEKKDGSGIYQRQATVTLYVPDIELDLSHITEFDAFRPNRNDEINKHAYTHALLDNDSSIELGFGLENLNTSLRKCYTVCQIGKRQLVNPYVRGFRGAWRKKKDYLYLNDRNYTASLNTRTDGTYKDFDPFWQYSSTNKKYNKTDNWRWTWTSEVTKYTKNGTEIENRDALNRYSAAIYGYNNTLPIGVASNAKYKQLAYDGFEDYNYFKRKGCNVLHWSFKNSTGSGTALDYQVKHTGKKSLRLNAGSEASVTREVMYCSDDTATLWTGAVLTSGEYKVTPCNCHGLFSPDSGKYVISGWVKLDTTPYATTFQSPYISVQLNGGTEVRLRATGPIIEGWQRIEGVITVPSTAVLIVVGLNASTATTTWFDDIRIHPFDGNMKTYAYDERSMKLLAEMDENNYATIYEYDEQGSLIRVKKETINGIMTLKENRSASVKMKP